ncbi:MAG: membrane protein insertase YidC, partial [Propionibacterium sp.]
MMTPLLGIWDSFYNLLSAMMQPLYWAVSGLMVLFHNLWGSVFSPDSGISWVLSIISLTIVIRTLLIPLFVKQINSARNMQLLGPKQKALQEKYGHDRERLGVEMQKMFKEEGVNPLASCTPILLQMPIFLALIRVLDGAARGQVRGHFLKENPQLVESLNNSQLFGVSMADTFLPLDPFGARQIFTGILVILMVGVLFITQLQLMQKNMPPEAKTGPMAQQQKMMLYLFPLMFAVSGLMFPVGVLVYWLTSNIWTMGQQYILIHNNPAPNTPAYVDWEERMRKKGKDPHEITRLRNEKRRRSL